MPTLTEIKQALSRYENAGRRYYSDVHYTSLESEFNASGSHLLTLASDVLRTLLPVVEAAKIVAETDSQYTRHSRDEIVALQKALKAIE